MKVVDLIDKLKEYNPDMTIEIIHRVRDEYEEETYIAIKNNARDEVGSIYDYD